ncbi:MAG: DUF5698 domain-containing protein [Gemmatimonadota bacterium]
MTPAVLLTSLGIIVARIFDVSLGTIRTIYLVRGMRARAAFLGFFEVLIWIAVVSGVIQNLDHPIYMVSYAFGFALGTYIGIGVEARLTSAQQVVRIFSRLGDRMTSHLRDLGFVVTQFEGVGREGPISLLFLEVSRRRVPKVISEAVGVDPTCFCIVDDVRQTSGAVVRSASARRPRVFGVRK